MSGVGAISVDSRQSFAPGRILLGRYRVERILGEGGMGVVVGARHIELEHAVAFKFLRGDATAYPEIVERFMREARSAAKLEGEHVARVHDVGRLETGEPYMLLEHLNGEDLDAMLARRGPLPLATALDYVLQACEAVEEAHAQGIIHRDLKPSNLFLHTPKSGRASIKVLDFGISKDLGAEGAKLTSSQALIGSPLYMSPEQALQPSLVDARSDVWALTVVLYELVTGRAPFVGESIAQVIASILQETPTPPSALSASLPAWLDDVVERGLEKSIHRRTPTVRAFADELRLELEGLAPASKLAASLPLPLGASDVKETLQAPKAEPAPRPQPSRSPLPLPLPLPLPSLEAQRATPGVTPASTPLAAMASATLSSATPAPTRVSSKRGFVVGFVLAACLVVGVVVLSSSRFHATPAPEPSASTAPISNATEPSASGVLESAPRAGPSVAVIASAPASPEVAPTKKLAQPASPNTAKPAGSASPPTTPTATVRHDPLDSL